MQTMLREASISFPMFGNFSINPPASFQLFGHTFYWYGVIIALCATNGASALRRGKSKK